MIMATSTITHPDVNILEACVEGKMWRESVITRIIDNLEALVDVDAAVKFEMGIVLRYFRAGYYSSEMRFNLLGFCCDLNRSNYFQNRNRDYKRPLS